jgi:hypothetical protein
VALRYRLETDSSLTFDNPQPRDHDYNEFSLHLADGVLTCEMTAHYASANEARAVVDPVLQAWEVDVALQRGRGVLLLWFVVEKAEIVDRDPPPPGSPRTIALSTQLTTKSALSAMASISWRDYPAPPARFTVSPDVEILWYRYKGYVQGREALPAMAYFCLSVVEKVLARDRDDAARKYHVQRKILDTLGRLHTRRGDMKSRRKVERESDRHEPPLTLQEVSWMEAALTRLIHRVGEHAADPTAPCPLLGMSDLPPL